MAKCARPVVTGVPENRIDLLEPETELAVEQDLLKSFAIGVLVQPIAGLRAGARREQPKRVGVPSESVERDYGGVGTQPEEEKIGP